MNKIKQWEKEILQLEKRLVKPKETTKSIQKQIRDRKRWINVYRYRENNK